MAEQSNSILVTGATGLLGRALVRHLNSEGATQLLTPGRSELDLTNRDAVIEYFILHGPKTVYHLAALVFGLGGNSKNQLRSLSENGLVNDNLFSACAAHPPEHMFFAGTVAAYPFPYKTMPLIENEFFDGLPHRGEFGYAMAKRNAYAYLEILSKETHMKFTYGVLTNLYGPGDRFDIENGHVVPSLIAKAHNACRSGLPLKVWGDGSATRDFMFIDDAARAIHHCVLSHGKSGGNELVNISSGEEVSIGYLAQCVATQFEGLKLEFDTSGAVGVPKRVIDNSRLKQLGFQGFTPMADGISATCDWYKNNAESART